MQKITINELADATVLAIKALVTNDPRATAEGKRRILNALASSPDEPKVEEVLTIPEVAERLHKTKRAVHIYCRMGLLKKVQFPGQSRASGILASSLDALLSGATATIA